MKLLPSRTLTIAAIAALLICGGLVAAAAGSSREPSAVGAEFIVPIGHIGDELSYEGFASFADEWYYPEEGAGSSTFGPEPYEDVARISGLVLIPDQAGSVHTAIRVEDLPHEFPIPNPVERIRAHGTEFGECDTGGGAWSTLIDISTRDVVGHRFLSEEVCPVDAAAGPNHPNRYTSLAYGPNLSGNGLALYDSHWLASVLQGRPLSPGDRLTDIEERRRYQLEKSDIRGGIGTQLRPVELDLSLTVLGPQEYEGEVLWAIEGKRRLVQGDDEWKAVDYSNETLLFASGLPWAKYQISTTEYAEGDGTEFYRLSMKDELRLTDFIPGEQPIPWGPAQLGLLPQLPRMEFSRGPVPESGTAFRSPHRAEDSIASVESDPSLIGLRLWRLQNPGSLLVGLRFAPTAATPGGTSWTNPAGSTTWTLVYAVPGGPTAYRVQSMRGPGGSIQNMEGPWSKTELGWGQVLRAEDLPQRTITFGSARQVWETIMEPYRGQTDANYFVWGYGALGDPYYVHLWRHQGFRAAIELIRVAVGHIDASGVEEPRVAPTSATATMVSLNVSTGEARRGVYAGWDSAVPTGSPAGAVVATDRAAGAWNLPAAAVLATTSLVALLTAAYFYPALKVAGGQLLGWFGGYAKLSKAKVLANTFRDQLLQLIRADPGISPPELHRRVGGGWSTIVYHLGVLQKNKLATSIIDGRHRRFFPVESLDASKRAPMAVLRNARTKRVFDIIANQPGVHQRYLSGRVGVTHGATQWHLERLQKVGLIRAQRAGRQVRYFAAAGGAPPPVAGGPFPATTLPQA